MEGKMSCEEHLFNVIRLHTVRGNFKKVYDLIKGNTFTDWRKAVKLWDEAHYAEKEMELGRPINAVTKFRIREKCAPPPHLCMVERSKICLPRHATKVLRSWLQQHMDHPYPSRLEKQRLADEAQLTFRQVQTWFANTRRRNSSVFKNASRESFPINGFNNYTEQIIYPDAFLVSSNIYETAAFVEICDSGYQSEVAEVGMASCNAEITFDGGSLTNCEGVDHEE